LQWIEAEPGRELVNKETLIRVATEYARQQGWRVENYTVSSVRKRQGRYRIQFQGKSGLVGDHFSVWVDASTGQATQLIPGR
jgi:hypothetical protein